ncbi:MAG: hypothetical protein ABSE52_02235 [Candidatus Dormibacteria bacterium]
MSKRSVRTPVIPAQTSEMVAGGWEGAGALLGFVVMLVAVFLPFAHLTCQSCPAVTSTHLSSGNLVGGTDGWRVLVLAIAGLVTTGSYLLLAPSRRQTALGSLVLALAAGALVVVDAANTSTRVLGWPGAGLSDVAQGPGFYLALVGALAVCLFSVLMVASQRAPRS